MKVYIQICRFIVGILFVFSGAVKVIDPVGTAIKLEEYFEVFSTDFSPIFGYLIPFALAMSLVFCVLEVVLGAALLVGFAPRLTARLLLVLIVFFTFLTFYSAYYNKVTDCGCFGDFVKLAPWTSFWKDIFLLILIGFLNYKPDLLETPLTSSGATSVTVITIAVASFVAWFALYHLPIIDFRPYAVGLSLPEQMKLPDGAKTDRVEMIMQKGDEKKTVSAEDYAANPALWQDTTWRVIDSKTIPGDRPKITDYSISDDKGVNVTDSTMQGAWFWVIILDAKKADPKRFNQIQATTDILRKTQSDKVNCAILCASSYDDIESIRHETQLALPVFSCDATVLKTIMRANPGTWLVKDGVVLGKWHNLDTPLEDHVIDLIDKAK
jgi:uncharacterized membrane protein YphA (DoxX/SURF4 family)